MNVSVVIPIYNESESIGPLFQELVSALDGRGLVFEILIVDDGSSDLSFERAAAIAHDDQRLRVIKLTKNFGQTTALKAGFDHARGDVIVTMDGDLQNDPADILRLIDKLDEGYDMVAGWRADRKDTLLSRRLPSQVGNWLVRRVTGVQIRDNGCALRAYRSEVITKHPLYSEMHRLLPTILGLGGARFTEIQVAHHARRFGESKYGISRTYKLMLDLFAIKTIISRYRYPLYGFGSAALLFGLLSLGFIVAAIVPLASHPDEPTIVYTGAGVLLGSLSISLLMLGFLSELVYETGQPTPEIPSPQSKSVPGQ